MMKYFTRIGVFLNFPRSVKKLLLLDLSKLYCFLYSWEPVVGYINEQYDKYLKEELSINRRTRIPDNRVHCCLYFISPTGHRYALHISAVSCLPVSYLKVPSVIAGESQAILLERWPFVKINSLPENDLTQLLRRCKPLSWYR